MKLYKVMFDADVPGGRAQTWVGTQADVRETRREKKGLDPQDEEVDVPTSKAELLAWLNENCNVAGE